LGLLAWGVVLAQTAVYVAGTPIDRLRSPRRYWEDMQSATRLLFGVANESNPPEPKVSGQAARDFVSTVGRQTRKAGIAPWQFWRVTPRAPLKHLASNLPLPRSFEDPGRSRLIWAGYEVVGGVAPFLGLWLGAFAMGPLFAWLGVEFAMAGRALAGAVFLFALALSRYFIETLALPHAAIGFYLLAWLGISILVASGFRQPPQSRIALLARCAVCGLIVAACAACRSGTILLVPGFMIAILFASTANRRARFAVLVPALCLFVAVVFFLKPASHHNVWPSLWEGLGDFDATKGYTWSDRVAKETLRKAGVDSGSKASFGFEGDAVEGYFRDQIVSDVKADPAWYAGILVRRVWATVSLQKLWPLRSRDDKSVEPFTRPNEGNIDKYYRMTTSVDFFSLGKRRFEAPISFLVAPTLALLILAWRRGGRFLENATWLCAPACGALALPVVVSTAGGVETQVFGLVYFLGAGLLIDEAVRQFRVRFATVRAAAPALGPRGDV